MASYDYAMGSKDVSARAAAFGMPAVKVDGNDIFAVPAAVRDAGSLAREGGGSLYHRDPSETLARSLVRRPGYSPIETHPLRILRG